MTLFPVIIILFLLLQTVTSEGKLYIISIMRYDLTPCIILYMYISTEITMLLTGICMYRMYVCLYALKHRMPLWKG